jgi:multidrug efflux system membrane fusion protein
MTIRSRGLAFTCTVALLMPACRHHGAGKAAPRPVRVESVRNEAGATALRYSATIQPREQVSLAFKVSGYVREVHQVPGADGRTRNLQQGDLVRHGMVLARVDPAGYQEKVDQARAQLAESEASLAKSRSDAARAEALYAAKALTRPDYDAATSGVAGATAHVAAAKAQLEQARISLADASLVAPIDGVVLSRSVEVGSLANIGSAGFTLADLTQVKAVFGVPDQLVERVKIGAPLNLTSDSFGPEIFPGRVTAVSPSADAQSRVFGVEVTIPNRDGRLKAGMIATVEVAAANAAELPAGSPSVSVSAVVKSARAGAFAVFVAEGTDDDATARIRDVSLGRISGNRIAVSQGLKPGDRVIVSGASLLVDGDRVRIIPGDGE